MPPATTAFHTGGGRMTKTYLDLAVRLFGRYRDCPPSGYFFFCDGRVVFNAVTAEIMIGNTVIEMEDFVDELTIKQRGDGGYGRSPKYSSTQNFNLPQSLQSKS